MISLLIEDVEVDVLQTEQIVTEYSVAPIGDISKRTGARSIQFKLPRTPKNRAVFEASELPISTSVKPYQRLKARLYVDGVDMNILFATLESVKDYYFIRVYGSNVDFFNIIKDAKLSDLNLNDLNHHWDFVTVRESRLNTEGYIYPLINWNADAVVGATAREQCSRLLVSVYAETLLQRICRDAGYTLNNQLLNDTDYNYAAIVVPYNADEYERDNRVNRYLNAKYEFAAFSNSPTTEDWDLTNLIFENETFFSNQNPAIGGIRFQDMIIISFEIELNVFNTTGSDKTITITPNFYDNNGNFTSFENINVVIPDTGAVTPHNTIITNSFPYILTGAQKGLPNVFFSSPNLTFTIINTTSGVYANAGECTFEITDVEMITEQINWDGLDRQPSEIKSVLWDATNPINLLPKEFDYVTVANLLLDLKQSDFLKNFLQLHGAIVQVNEQLKTVTIAKFEQVLNNLGSAIDWTGKLDFIEEYETKFQLDYAQNNYLRYKDEDGVIKPDGTDSNLTVADENLEFEKDFIELDFGATETGVWFSNGNNTFTYNTPNIKVLESGLVAEITEPRLLYLKQIDGYTHTYRDGASQFDVNTSAPIAWFIDADFTHSLGFGSDLYERYYSFLEGILDRTKVIEAKIRLNTSDIAQLDFLKPVYIGELDAYFYVSKVKFDYTSNASSIVELVKLL